MNVLLPACDEVWQRAHQLAQAMTDHVGGRYDIAALDIERSLASTREADFVVLIHGIPTVDMNSYISQSLDMAPQVPLLIADVPNDGHLIARYLMDGASGCLLEEHGVEELGIAFDEVQKARPYLPYLAQAALLDHFVTISHEYQQIFGKDVTTGLEVLTEREREVLKLLAEDLTNRQIADRLFVEVGTVKNHVHSILTKLELNDRHAAAMFHNNSASLETNRLHAA